MPAPGRYCMFINHEFICSAKELWLQCAKIVLMPPVLQTIYAKPFGGLLNEANYATNRKSKSWRKEFLCMSPAKINLFYQLSMHFTK